MTLKFGVLYICTGRYKLFWENFYKSAQTYLLTNGDFEKHFYVFTDSKHIAHEDRQDVHKFFQKQLPWPLITLRRFAIFQNAFPSLETMDYIFFFNANMLFVDHVGEEILPTKENPLSFLIHPAMANKERATFTYERNPDSLAYIPENFGNYYYQGCLNGGLKDSYISMIKELSYRIEEDYKKGIIAVWHDESHLNKYALENQHCIKNIPVEFGWPQGWKSEKKPKIVSLDKNNFGGHGYLRSNQSAYVYRVASWISKTRKKISKRIISLK